MSGSATARVPDRVVVRGKDVIDATEDELAKYGPVREAGAINEEGTAGCERGEEEACHDETAS